MRRPPCPAFLRLFVCTHLVATGVAANRLCAQDIPTEPVEKVFNFEYGPVRPQLIEASALIRATQARSTYNVDGSGLTVAVFDTGINTTHVDFAGRIAGGRNFSDEDSGNPAIFEDRQGHGSNCAGISMAKGTLHTGIAPGAEVYSYKILDDSGSGNFTWMRDALIHLRDNRAALGVTAVNMSVGDGQNYVAVPNIAIFEEIRDLIDELRAEDVVFCVSAGNSFFSFGSAQGMGFPGICDGSTSVGAVYDGNLGGFSYSSGAIAFSTGARRLTPFSQRLHTSLSSTLRTDIFAPGAAITAPGVGSSTSSSTLHGTSQASPCIAGVALLIQEYHLRRTGELPTVNQVENWLRTSGESINDGDDEDDNVANTGLNYVLVDVLAALDRVRDATGGPRNRRPTARAGRNIVVTTNRENGARVTLDGSASSDPEGRRLKFLWKVRGVSLNGKRTSTPTGLFPVGQRNVTLTVTDVGGLKDSDTVQVTVRLRNANARSQGAYANGAFDEAEASALEAAAGSAGASVATGLAYASLAVGYGDAAGEFVRWDDGQSEADALLAYAETRALQQAYGAAAAGELFSAYAETGDESLLSAYVYAVSGAVAAHADLTTP